MKFHLRSLFFLSFPIVLPPLSAQIILDAVAPCEDGFHWSYRKDATGGYSWSASDFYAGVPNPEFIGTGIPDDPFGIHVFNDPDPFKMKRIWLELTFGPEVKILDPGDPTERPTLQFKDLVFPVTFLDDPSGSVDSFFDVFVDLDLEPADSFFDVFVDITIDGPAMEKTLVWYWELFPQPPEEWILFDVPTELTVTPALLIDLKALSGELETLPIIGLDIYTCCVPEPTVLGWGVVFMAVGLIALRRHGTR